MNVVRQEKTAQSPIGIAPLNKALLSYANTSSPRLFFAYSHPFDNCLRPSFIQNRERKNSRLWGQVLHDHA